MNCESVRPLLYRLIEDRLLAADAPSVRAHIDACADCAHRLREIASLDESVMDAESEEPPASLRPKLLAAYRGVMADRRVAPTVWERRTAIMRRAAVFALIAVGSGTATWLGVRPGYVSPVPPPQMVETRVTLDDVFPLRLSTPYTIQDADGRTQRGVRIVSVQ